MRIATPYRARPLLAYALMIALAALAFAIFGPDRTPPGGSGDATAGDYYLMSGGIDLRFPVHEELIDWVSFADQVSVITVLPASEIEPVTVVKSGYEFVETPPTFRVEETVWRRDQAPELADGSLALMDGAQWGTIGDDTRAAVTWWGMVNLVAGQRYLTALMRAYDRQTGDPVWLSLPYSTLPLEGETIVRPDTGRETLWPSVEAMIGKSLDEAAETLSDTEPYVFMLGRMSLGPDARMDSWVEARHRLGGSGEELNARAERERVEMGLPAR